MAAVITVTRGFAAICVANRCAGDVRVRGDAALLWIDASLAVRSPKRGGRVEDRPGPAAAGWKPCPFSVTTCSSTGPRASLTICRYLQSTADVVAVDRADVAEAQLLEQHAAVQAGLDRFLELAEKPLDRIAQQRHLVQDLRRLRSSVRCRTG